MAEDRCSAVKREGEPLERLEERLDARSSSGRVREFSVAALAARRLDGLVFRGAKNSSDG